MTTLRSDFGVIEVRSLKRALRFAIGSFGAMAPDKAAPTPSTARAQSRRWSRVAASAVRGHGLLDLASPT
ncbi:MAG: hypothetical protein U0174_17545 [Polyangiaceae bacterium]